MTTRQSLFVFSKTYPWGHHCATIAPLLIILASLTFILGDNRSIAQFFMDFRPEHPRLTVFFQLITDWTNPLFYFIYAYFFWQGVRTGNKAQIKFVLIYAALQLLISFLLVRITKMTIGKPRPMSFLKGEGYIPFTMQHGHHSFPSGHTTEIIGSAVPLAVQSSQWKKTCLFAIIVALVGFSRIYLSMHHAADIVGGIVFGSFLAFFIQYFCTRKQQ